jgi:hypothetical protein
MADARPDSPGETPAEPVPPSRPIALGERVPMWFHAANVVLGCALVAAGAAARWWLGTSGLADLVLRAVIALGFAVPILGIGLHALPEALRRRGTTPARSNIIRLGFSMLAMMTLFPLIAFAAGQSPLAMLLQFWWMPAWMIGLAMVQAGFTARSGTQRFCPSCEYPFEFADEDTAPSRCPECGTAWLNRWTIGLKTRRPKLIAGGAAVAILSLALTGPWLGMLPVAPYLSTPALVRWICLLPDNAGSAWAELPTRTLTPAQTEELFAALLDRRKRGMFFTAGVAAKTWLDTQVGTRSVSPALTSRFFEEMVTVDLWAPARVRVGQPFQAGLINTNAEDGFAYKAAMVIGGIDLDTPEPLHGRGSQADYLILINPKNELPDAGPGVFTFTATKPGKATLRAVLWVCVANGFAPSVRWNTDGTPIFDPPPGSSVVWSSRLVLEREIDVRP